MGSQRRAEAFRTVLARSGFESEQYDFQTKVEEIAATPHVTADAWALAPLLTNKPHPVGVLALGDPFARVAWRICDELGLEVPRQVAIVGVNDLPVAFAHRPTITSIHYPGEEVGYRATQLLIKLIEGGRRPRKPVGIRATQLIPRESTVGAAHIDDAVVQALEMIRRQACYGLRADDVAAALAVSRRWLELEFRKQLGRSPLEEISRVRLATTRKLLQTTKLPIHQIAGMTGFSETSGLTHFFQKHTHLSPTEFRKWAREDSSEQGPP
jgi:LacI family transcriptional regulator